MGAPETVPAGEYARQSLTKLDVWDKVKDKAVLGKDVQTVASYVESGNVDAGIVFASVVMNNNNIKIVAEAPAGTHENIVFSGVVLAGTQHTKEAEQFFAFLVSPEAKRIFEKYGFNTVN